MTFLLERKNLVTSFPKEKQKRECNNPPKANKNTKLTQQRRKKVKTIPYLWGHWWRSVVKRQARSSTIGKLIASNGRCNSSLITSKSIFCTIAVGVLKLPWTCVFKAASRSLTMILTASDKFLSTECMLLLLLLLLLMYGLNRCFTKNCSCFFSRACKLCSAFQIQVAVAFSKKRLNLQY